MVVQAEPATGARAPGAARNNVSQPRARRNRARKAPTSTQARTKTVVAPDGAPAYPCDTMPAPKERSPYWTINGKRYDFSSFVDRHPGGRKAISLAKGRDCTELFYSYHALSDAPFKLLEKFYVDDNGAKPEFDWNNTPFYDEAKKRVRAYFRDNNLSHHCTYGGAARLVLFVALTVVAYCFWLQGYVGALLALPLCYWLGCSRLMHSGAHFAISKYPAVNHYLSLLGSAHVSITTWHHQHNLGHHSHTNDNERDPDLHHFQQWGSALPGFRLHPKQPYCSKYKWWQASMRLQSTMATIGPSLLNEPIYMMTEFCVGTIPYYFEKVSDRYWHYAGRVLVVCLAILPQFWLRETWLGAFAFALVPYLLHGVLYYAFSQVSHLTGPCFQHQRDGDKPGGMEWAEVQVRSAQDYSSDSMFWGILSMDLNHQITHHLFPGVDSSHFMAITPIVKQVAEEMDIPFRSDNTYWDLYKQHIDYVGSLNDPSRMIMSHE